MMLLSDAADAIRSLLGADVAPTLADAATLEGEPGKAWRAIASDGRLFHAAATGQLGALGGPLLIQAYAARSQFGRMQELLAAGEQLADGLACVALDGARFRGQRGRVWSTHRGNLHLSVHMALALPAGEAQAGLAVLPAVAAARATEAVSGGRVRPRLKWVNDLLLGRAKIGGVLAASQVHSGRLSHAVFGIGLNVAVAPTLPAGPRALPAARLADADPCFAGEDAWARLLPELLSELAQARRTLVTTGSVPLLDAYRERAAFLGRAVTIWPVESEGDSDARPLARGRVREILPDLSLRIDGQPQPIRHGRMTIDD